MAKIYSITIAFLFAIIHVTMGETWEDPQTYFGVKAVNVTWAHAVNNKSLLDKAVSDKGIMMLEADVNLVPGKNNIPMMAHKPNDSSDLSLDDFIKTIVDKKGKQGIKLDFKSDAAFNASLPVLKTYQSNMKFPLILNADILVASNNTAGRPLNATTFLDGAKTIPNSIVSVGWDTGYGEKNYTQEDVKRMSELITKGNISQPITYPVQASLAVNSVSVLADLLNGTAKNNATLTVWTSQHDTFNRTLLDDLINKIGSGKVYVDIGTPSGSIVPPPSSSALSLATTSLIGSVLTFVLVLQGLY